MTTLNGIYVGRSEPSVPDLTQEDLQELLDNIELLDENERAELLLIAATLEDREFARACRDDLIEFCKAMQPDYLVGAHHKHLAKLLTSIEKGEKDRVTVSIAPRHGKSQMTSIFFSAWFLGKNPSKQVMLVSHTTDLAVDFGRKVRNLIDSPQYQKIFPGVQLAADSKSAGRWNTNSGGVFYATGVGSSLAGRGADLLLCLAGTAGVITPKGTVEAKDIRVGDKVLGYKGFHEVKKVFRSKHDQHVVINGDEKNSFSKDHPIWTYTRGWVVAESLTTYDLLDTLNLFELIGVFYEKINNYTRRVNFKNLQHLGTDAAAVQQPKRSKLQSVWWSRDNLLRTVGKVFKLLQRHGTHPFTGAHTGPIEQRWELLTRELLVGVSGEPTKQSAQQHLCNCIWTNTKFGAVGPENGAYTRADKTQGIFDGDERRGCFEGRENELGSAPYCLSQFGWLRRAAFRVYSRWCKEDRREEGVLVGCAKAFFSSKTCGLLLGVRRPKRVEVRDCVSSTDFYNFYVPEFNTIYVNSWMTHNCDDLHSEQDLLAGNFAAFETAYKWFTFGARTRLMPGGRIAVVGTRWHKSDLIGRLIKDMSMSEEADQYEVVEFPAILNENTPEEKALWPEFFDLDALKRSRASMPAFQWNAQYQQNPTGEGGALVKRDDFRRWDRSSPPTCDYIIQAIDAAAELKQRSDYTSIATWGVFWNEDEGANQIILLNSVRERYEFPELKAKALSEYLEYRPDVCLVEKKSSGTALYQEMRRGGIPVSECTPHRGTINNPNTKYARFQPLVDLIKAGLVWVPETRWAEQLVEEVCEFPYGDHDDMVDTTVMVLDKFRKGGLARLPTDEADEPRTFKSRRGGYY